MSRDWCDQVTRWGVLALNGERVASLHSKDVCESG